MEIPLQAIQPDEAIEWLEKCYNPCFIGNTSARVENPTIFTKLKDLLQSLFYWKYLCKLDQKCQFPERKGCYNPCFIGNTSARNPYGPNEVMED